MLCSIGYMPQMMANAMPAALPVMHGGAGGSRGNVYKYPPMTMHNAQHQQQQQQQHVYQQQTVQQQTLPSATVANQPPVVVVLCDHSHRFTCL